MFPVETYRQTNFFKTTRNINSLQTRNLKLFISVCTSSKFMSFTRIKKFRNEVTIQNYKKSDARAMHSGQPKMPGRYLSVGKFQQKIQLSMAELHMV